MTHPHVFIISFRTAFGFMRPVSDGVPDPAHWDNVPLDQ